jgi:hypothetical protein
MSKRLILPNGAIIESDNVNDFLPFVERKAKAADPVASEKRKKYARRVGRTTWSGQEIETVAQNLNRPYRELLRMLPGRTISALSTMKWQLKNNKLSKSKEKIYTDYLNHTT